MTGAAKRARCNFHLRRHPAPYQGSLRWDGPSATHPPLLATQVALNTGQGTKKKPFKLASPALSVYYSLTQLSQASSSIAIASLNSFHIIQRTYEQTSRCLLLLRSPTSIGERLPPRLSVTRQQPAQQMLTTSFSFPSHSYVLAVATSTFFLNTVHMLRTAKFRKLAQVPYPAPYASDEQVAKNPSAAKFNCGMYKTCSGNHVR